MKYRIILSVIFSTLILSQVMAQYTLPDNIKIILTDPDKGEPYLKEYVQPVATAFGTISGGALFHRANVKSFPHLDIGISFVHVYIPDRSKYFRWEDGDVPTFFGKQEVDAEIVPGSDLKTLSIPYIQLNLGLFADFELMVRGISSYKINEIGKIDLYGLGIKYGLSDLLPGADYIIDLSVQASYHALRVDNWLNAGTFGMNIQASRDFAALPFGIYSGVGYEATSMTIMTEKMVAPGSITHIGDVKLNGENKLRFILGASVTLFFMTFHLDYNISEYHSITGGAKLVF